MRFRLVVLVVAVLSVATGCSSDSTPAASDSASTGSEAPSVLQPDEPVDQRIGSYAGSEPAPEFPGGLDWLNIDRPLTMAALRGKVVVLDFWTYGCINCIHVIPDVKRLEAEYPEELVVIGVHSAKFTNEGETENIRDVIARYDLQHPVVNDRDFAVWRLWGAQAWPTLVIVDPAGNVVGGHSGEGIYAIFQPVIDSLVEEFDDRGMLNRVPLAVVLEQDAYPDSVLSFPGKVLADGPGNRLFVADTNHHRIVVADLTTGEVLDVAGSGIPGFGDGDFGESRFDQPQGMVLSDDGSTLYVADTGSHAVRALHLDTRVVTTILGTGQQAQQYPPRSGVGDDVAISSPWDLALDGETLYIAMAGSHQIWSYDLVSELSDWYVGNGRESTYNSLRFEAELAQPSAVVVLAGGRLAFADAESSAIRFADPGPQGATGVLAGTDQGLFDFGDTDGVGTEARLQHPLGLDFGDGALWVADTYNSKVKRLDPQTGEIATFAGSEQGWADGVGTAARFSEPGGVSYADGLLYVADTNNQAIRVLDIATGAVTTKVLFGIERFPAPDASEIPTTDLGTLEVAPGRGEILLDIALPPGYKLNDLAPFSMEWDATGSEIADPVQSIVEPGLPLTIEAVFGAGDIGVDVTIYYCTDEAEDLCFIDQVRLEAVISPIVGGPSSTTFRHSVPVPGI